MRNSLRIGALLLLAPVAVAQNLPAARAFVQHIYGAYAHPASQADLLGTPQGWRVDDVSTADTPSLRKFLQQSR